MKISGVIITRNEEKHIFDAVKNLFEVCDEVVVVDSGSTDKTEELAKKAGAKFIFNEWPGYVEQRNFCHKVTENNWLLVLDADERLSKPLIKEIKKLKENGFDENIRGFEFLRNLYFLGKPFKNNRFNCEKKIRLYHKDYGKWEGGRVHENIKINGKVKRINKFIDHYPYPSIEFAVEKLNNYAYLKAYDKFDRGKKTNLLDLNLKIFFTFLKKYILDGKFLKGSAGFILAKIETNYTFLKYAKLYELNKNKEKKNE
ncbi:glycosyl transferase family 2 [Thermotomaculum hydrothermale]|uniref:Glycosyl transferase family 2 n=1 Tax=Thermotomaculum hydrothermale TaxID=981385 RepID=A0A7R6PWW0_9BACT|nr:glycosyltransferase family 2 protein [Thermotomaculum hydrothermale]BBB32135.1 glycosyl transferase family 2 [Thermotomaculum hydrothermale]